MALIPHDDNGSEPLDVRQLQPHNLSLISSLTGRSVEDLRAYMEEARGEGKSAYILISRVADVHIPPKPDPELMGQCYYKKRMNPMTQGEHYICIIHNQESKWTVLEGSRLPCLGLDPADVEVVDAMH